MFSGILDEFTSTTFPSQDTPFSNGFSLNVNSLGGSELLVRQVAHRSLLGKPDPNSLQWNCMTMTMNGKRVFSYADQLFAESRGFINTPQGWTANSQIQEVLGKGRDSSVIAARDVNGRIAVLDVADDNTFKLLHKTQVSADTRVGFTSSGFCLSDDGYISVFEFGYNKPVASFLEGGGPVVPAISDPNLIFHGSTESINCLDLREGSTMPSVKAHPAAVTLTAYTKELEYSLLSVNPTRPEEIAAFSKSHCVLQFFDIRRPRQVVSELALPGREFVLTPRLIAQYRYLDYSPDGRRVLVAQPLCDRAYVCNTDGSGRASFVKRIPVAPSTKITFEVGSQGGRRKRPEVPVSVGVSWGSSCRSIDSITNYAQLCQITEGGYPSFSPEGTQPISSPTPSFKKIPKSVCVDHLERILRPVEHRKKQRKTLKLWEMVWIQCKIGACVGIAQCETHPNASKSDVGSFLWTQCVSSCPGRRLHRPLPWEYKFTFVYDMVTDFWNSYGYHINEQFSIDYLDQLSEDDSDMVSVKFNKNRGTVEVFRVGPGDPDPDYDPPATIVPTPVEEGGYDPSKSMLLFSTLPHLSPWIPASERRLINKRFIKNLRQKSETDIQATSGASLLFADEERVVFVPTERRPAPVKTEEADDRTKTRMSRAGF
jgi:hypothetical protein